MSKEIDERIVSMQFDNANFERNISTTMNTLDKFNNKLKFEGATTGLQNISSASSRMDFSGVGRAIDTIHAKFSALEIMGVTALANITNSIINMAKNLATQFTIAPITTGLSEYETKINAIQTIMSNTESKGTTLDEVTETLNELNTYADKTIYNFAEMTRNIGTFTAAGIGLKDSAASIQGIANLAAASGSNAQQASTAMYQLSQALASGSVKLMDWNSVVNAGMGGQLFQDALKATAKEHGVAVDKIIKDAGSFRESLKEEWITTEVLNDTLKKFTVEGASEYAEAMIKSGKYTNDQADAILKQARSMEEAATKVKTFTQLLDTLKEAAQSGWAQTWEAVIGNFDQSKALFSSLSDQFGAMIADGANARNELLADTLNSKWDTFLGKLKLAGVSTEEYSTILIDLAKKNKVPIDELIKQYGSLGAAIDHGRIPANLFTEALKNIAGTNGDTIDSTSDLTNKLAYFQKVVDEVWRGSYENGEERVKALADAGYDYDSVQKLVNKTVDGHRLTLAELTKEQLVSVAMTKKMSDAQLKSLGFTEDQVLSLRDLAAQADKTGTPINQLIQSMERPSGRVLLLETLQNTISAIVKPLRAIKKAWDETFNLSSGGLYEMIQAVHDLSENLVMSDDTADKLRRTFGGVFSLFKIIVDIVGGGLKAAFDLLAPVLGITSINLLDIAAATGDNITNFKNLIEQNNLVTEAFKKIADTITTSIGFVKKWINEFMKIPLVANAIEKFKENVTDLKDVGKNIIAGLKNGISDESKTLPDILKDIGLGLLKAIKTVLGIHSPSTEMYDVGGNIIQGLLDGIKAGFSSITDSSKTISEKVIEIFNNIPWGTIFAGAITIGVTAAVKNLSDSINNFSKPAAGLGDLLESTAKVVGKFSKVLGAVSFSMKMGAIKNLAIAVAILVGAVVVLTFLDPTKVWGAVKVVGALGAIIVALSVAADKLTKSDSLFGSGIKSAFKMGSLLTAMGLSLLLVSASILILGKMNPEQAKQGFENLAKLLAALSISIILMGIIAIPANESSVKQFSKMLTRLSVALLIMVVVVKLLGGMKQEELKQGGLAIAGMLAVFAVVTLITKISSEKQIAQFSRMMTSLGGSLLLMTVAIKLLGGMKQEEINQGLTAILGMVVILSAVVLLSNIGGSGSKLYGMSKLFNSIAVTILIMAVVVKLLGGMSLEEIGRGGLALFGIANIITMLVYCVRAVEKDAPKIAATILAISVAIGMLAAIVIALSLIEPEGLARGLATVGALSLFMMGLLAASQYAKGSTGTLVTLTVAIGVMAASVIALSLIDPEKLAGAVLALGIMMGMFILLMQGAKSIKGSLSTLIVLTVVIAALSGAIYLLSGIPVKDAMGSVGALSALMLSLVASMKIISTIKSFGPSVMIGTGIMVAVTGALTGMLLLLGGIPVKTLLGSAAALSILLLSLSASMVIISNIKSVSIKALATLGAMGLIVVALSGLMIAMVKLSNVSWGDIGKGLVLIAGVFVILGVAAYALSPVIPVVVLLAASILLIGAAVLTAGAGMMLFANSLGIMAEGMVALGVAFDTSGASIAAGITLLATTIATLIPVVAKGIGDGIIEFAKAITAGAPVIIAAVTSTVLAILQSISDTAPKFMETVSVVLVSFIKMLSDTIPKMVDLGMKLVFGILKGIADNIQGIVEMAITIMVNFIKGITSMIPDVIDAGFKLIIGFINGVADAIRGNTDALIDAVVNLFSAIVESIFKILTGSIGGITDIGGKILTGLIDGIKAMLKGLGKLISGICTDVIEWFKGGFKDTDDIGSNVIQGLIDGILGGLKGVTDAIGKVASGAVTTIKNLLGIHSPSSVFAKIGQFTSQGLAVGILSFGRAVNLSVEKVGSDAINTMSGSMHNLYSALNDINIGDISPKITPVLDLSNVKSRAKDLTTMFSDKFNVGLNPTVTAIGYIPSQRQSETSKLLSALGSVLQQPGDTIVNHYSIDGVTYDDGSNIASAIEAIVQAANVERRS